MKFEMQVLKCKKKYLNKYVSSQKANPNTCGGGTESVEMTL